MSHDRITLTVPAKSEYAKTVRMTASALVSRMGMTYDEVDDVRMAAEEAFVYAVESVADDAEITFEFDVSDDELSIEVRLGHEAQVADEDAERRAAYATFILESVCDQYEFCSDESGSARLRLLKRKGTTDAD